MPNWKKLITSGSDASLNSVTATAGFTGSLQGTGSWAQNAVTASYINSLQQDLTLNGAFTSKIRYSHFDTLINNYSTYGAGYGYSGEVFVYNNGINGFDIEPGLTLNSLISIGGVNGNWDYVQAWKDNSTGMLGFYIKEPITNIEGILMEGYIVLEAADITSPTIGAPIWFYQEAVNPPLPFNTTVYNGTNQLTIYQRLLGHLCYTNGSGLWILRFKPSNDWIQLQ